MERHIGVSMAPNGAEIEAKFLELIPLEYGKALKSKLLQARDIDGLMNTAKPFVGEVINLYVDPEGEVALDPEDRFSTKVRFMRDDGEVWFAVSDDITQL